MTTRKPRSIAILGALPDDAIISAGEAAAVLGKTTETLRRYRRSGCGPMYLSSRAGSGHAEYQMGAIRRWIAERGVTTRQSQTDGSKLGVQ